MYSGGPHLFQGSTSFPVVWDGGSYSGKDRAVTGYRGEPIDWQERENNVKVHLAMKRIEKLKNKSASLGTLDRYKPEGEDEVEAEQ